MRFADVLIEHPYSRKQDSFTYEIPEGLSLKRGSGVLVPFQKTQRPGLVLHVHENRPEFKTKILLSAVAEEALLQEWQLDIADWISEYYFCSKYDAIRLFLPKQIFKKTRPKKPGENKKIAPKEAPNRKLTLQQNEIIEKITAKKIPISLIQGVTGSGKTEIYTQLIKKCIQSGGQALVLAPEIALTPQLLKNFSLHFPRIAVIHSKMSESKRAEYWRAIHKGEIDLVLGSRSAVFAPLSKLGLIVIDEEHEWSYKQEQSPRYHARTVALKIAEKTGAQVVLGSATPSIESRWEAEQGRYQLFTISERISGTPLPQVQIVDMREELKGGNFGLLSSLLEHKISSTLAAHGQVILFLNRRGSASSTVCRDCGYTSKCPDCELPLTFHSKNFKAPLLICHHCGHLESVPSVCPVCKSARIKHLGLGTERVETELKKIFPTARIARADKDTMSKRNSHTELHDQLEKGEIDILIGTQMIGKGFDIAKVSLVGILMADLGLHIPDFRTSERLFQLLTQVSGRAGRREQQGTVVLQTYNPEHSTIRLSQNHDYNGFYEQEINARKEAGLPPFSKLIKLMICEKTLEKSEAKARTLQEKLLDPAHQIFSAPALFAKTKTHFQWNLLVQGSNPSALLKKLTATELENVRMDVDPLLSI